jgi:hypothetical protein
MSSRRLSGVGRRFRASQRTDPSNKAVGTLHGNTSRTESFLKSVFWFSSVFKPSLCFSEQIQPVIDNSLSVQVPLLFVEAVSGLDFFPDFVDASTKVALASSP